MTYSEAREGVVEDSDCSDPRPDEANYRLPTPCSDSGIVCEILRHERYLHENYMHPATWNDFRRATSRNPDTKKQLQHLRRW